RRDRAGAPPGLPRRGATVQSRLGPLARAPDAGAAPPAPPPPPPPPPAAPAALAPAPARSARFAVPCPRGRPSMTDPRIRPLAPEEAAPEVRPIFDTYLRERGNIPNMFRTVALRPAFLRTLIAHFRTVMNEGTVPPLLKELLWVRISHLNRCRY